MDLGFVHRLPLLPKARVSDIAMTGIADETESAVEQS